MIIRAAIADDLQSYTIIVVRMSTPSIGLIWSSSSSIGLVCVKLLPFASFCLLISFLLFRQSALDSGILEMANDVSINISSFHCCFYFRF